LIIPVGYCRRLYRVEPEGVAALQAARETIRSMWAGLEPLLGEL